MNPVFFDAIQPKHLKKKIIKYTNNQSINYCDTVYREVQNKHGIHLTQCQIECNDNLKRSREFYSQYFISFVNPKMVQSVKYKER